MKRLIPDSTETVIENGSQAYRIKEARQPTATLVTDKPPTQKLQKNQKEFGAASLIAKTLRGSLSTGMSEICESYVSGRLTAKFRSLAKYEDGNAGTRPLNLSKHGHHLNGFEFNTTAKYEDIFGAKYFIKPSSTRGQVIIHFPGFIPDETFVRPEEATNFKLNVRLVALSDYQYDSEKDSYQAIHDELNGKYGSFESKMFPLLKIPVDPLTIKVSLNESDLPSDTALFLVMAISFYKYEGGKFRHLPKESAMSIKRVY